MRDFLLCLIRLLFADSTVRKAPYSSVLNVFKERMFSDSSYTANIFDVIFTVFNCVPISTVISLYCLHLIAAPSTVE
jgi:hypothetical protein